MIILPCSLVATKWFEDSKRVLITAIFVSVGYSAFNKAFGITDFLYDIQRDEHTDEMKLIAVFSIKAAFAVVIAIFILLTFRSGPSVPPSRAADIYRDDDILGTYRQLFLSREFVLIALSQIFYYIPLTCINYNFRRFSRIYGFSNDQVDDMKLIGINCGIAGSFILGIFLHYTKLYKTANVTLGALCLLGFLLLFVVLRKDYTSM